MGNAKDSGVIDKTWEELTEIINKNLNKDMGSSKYRKPYQNAKKYYDEVFSKEGNADLYMSQKRELEKLKVQYKDEKKEWNDQNRINARVSQKLDELEEQLKDIGSLNFSPTRPEVEESDNDVLVMLSDFHIGQCFDSIFGKYNSGIAQKRLELLLSEILKIKKRHNSENVYVSILGDLISGNIHKSIAVTNRENVIEQIKISIQLISNFIFELSKIFENVYVCNVTGNHSRIDRKEDALHDERLDDLISWVASMLLSHVDNIDFKNTINIDSGISQMDIRGKKYISVHGDYDSFDKAGISKLCMMLGYVPYAILFGHLHTCSFDDCSNIKMIRGGSLSGTGDQYTIEKRLCGEPSQMVCVCDRTGVFCYYPVNLNIS